MLPNYLLSAYRSLLKNRIFSIINIAGLSIGMAAFLMLIQYVRFEHSYEKYNPNASNLYRITLNFYNGDEFVVTDCETHQAMGPLLKEKMPEVKDYVRMFHNDGLTDIKLGTQKFLEEGIYYADPSAIPLLAIQMMHGDPVTGLTEPRKAMFSATFAKKFFGRENIVGESIEMLGRVYSITGVFADQPANTHLKFSALLSHETLFEEPWYKDNPWGGNNEYTYLLMAPGTDLQAFNQKLTALCLSMKEQLRGNRYLAESVPLIHLYSNKTYEPEVNGSARTVFYFEIIAFFIILIAWVNYVNLSTARAMERAREVGVRKVIGSARSQLMIQFLVESAIINLVALSVALALFMMSLPMFRDLTGQSFPLDLYSDRGFWLIVAALFVVGTFLSGLYPAFVLSAFRPSEVLKGKFSNSSRGQLLRKGLVVFQFGTTIVLIAALIAVWLQMKFLKSYDLGMSVSQRLEIRVPQVDLTDSSFNATFHSMKTELQRIPHVQNVARSGSLPGLSLHELSSTSFTLLGQEGNGAEYYYFGVDADFFETMGMKIVAGKGFEGETLQTINVIVNEEATKRLGFKTPEEAIGAKITFRRDPNKYTVIAGVLKNFYQRSPKEAHIPMLFRYSEGADYFTVGMETDNIGETMAAVEQTWKKVFPGELFHYFFLDDRFDEQYRAEIHFGNLVGIFSFLAVVIACLGLFGLSSFTIARRTKEIGIRKVLGASVAQIVTLLSRDFARVVLIAMVVSLPVAYWAIDNWLSTYAVRIPIGFWIFAGPVVLIFGVAMGTVAVQTVRKAMANPTEALKQE